MELLYNRFNCSHEVNAQSSTNEHLFSMDAIGTPVLLVWSWTASIHPDFKEDYFHGRIFMGWHPFQLFKACTKRINKDSKKLISNEKHLLLDANRYKYGFIGGISFECTSGLLLEIKCIAPYNLLSEDNRKDRWNIKSFHLSAGYNFAKLLT